MRRFAVNDETVKIRLTLLREQHIADRGISLLLRKLGQPVFGERRNFERLFVKDPARIYALPGVFRVEDLRIYHDMDFAGHDIDRRRFRRHRCCRHCCRRRERRRFGRMRDSGRCRRCLCCILRFVESDDRRDHAENDDPDRSKVQHNLAHRRRFPFFTFDDRCVQVVLIGRCCDLFVRIDRIFRRDVCPALPPFFREQFHQPRMSIL